MKDSQKDSLEVILLRWPVTTFAKEVKGFAERRVVVSGYWPNMLHFTFFDVFVNKLFTAHHMPEINNRVDQTTVTRVLQASLKPGTILV